MLKSRVMWVAFCFVFLIILSGCSNEDKELLGKWEDDEIGFVTYEFKSDGKMVITADEETIKGTYEVDNGKITMEAKGKKETVNYSIKKNKLTMGKSKSDTLTFVKAGNKKSNTASKKKTKTTETASTPPKEEKRVVAPELELAKRDIELVKNDKGSLSYLGDTSDASSFTFALKYSGDMKLADSAKIEFRFIFDDGSDLGTSTFYGKRTQMDSDDELHIFTAEELDEPVVGKKLMRIDYTFKSVTGSSEDEGETKTITVNDTTETTKIPALYALENTIIPLTQTFEDDEKSIELNNATLDDTNGTLTLSGKVTFNEDGHKLASRLIRNIDQTVKEGNITTNNDEFFAKIPVDFTISYPTEQLIGDDDGAEVYIEINDALFPIDLRTGKKIEKTLTITGKFVEKDGGYLDNIPFDGLQLNNGETVYNVLSSSSPYWNFGIGSNEKGTFSFVLGKNYKTLNFTLASGKKLADKGGTYDVYVYGDDFETIQDSDEVKGKPIYHQTIKAGDQPKDVTLNVEGLKRIYLYYNSNVKSDEGEEKYLQLMLVNPTLQ